MKFSHAVGAMSALSLALVATVALACPPKQTPTPPPCNNPCGGTPTPTPCPTTCCSTCGSNQVQTWTGVSTSQSNTASGNFGTLTQENNADIHNEVWVGGVLASDSRNQYNQYQTGSNVTAAQQQQVGNTGAGIFYQANVFPVLATAQGLANSTQAQAIAGSNLAQTEQAKIHLQGQAVTNGNGCNPCGTTTSGYDVRGLIQQSNQGAGTGTLSQNQAIAGTGQVQGFVVPPWPASFTVNVGGVVGRLTNTISSVLTFGF